MKKYPNEISFSEDCFVTTKNEDQDKLPHYYKANSIDPKSGFSLFAKV